MVSSPRLELARCAVAVMLMALVASADTLSVGLERVANFSGDLRGATVGRIVVSFPLPDVVRRARLDFAKLELSDVLPESLGERVTIEMFDCRTAWQAGLVTWTSPWRTPGGDYDSTTTTRYVLLPARANRAVFNVTESARRWQSGAPVFGLLVKRPSREGGGFRLEGARVLQALRAARVKLYYSPIQE